MDKRPGEKPQSSRGTAEEISDGCATTYAAEEECDETCEGLLVRAMEGCVGAVERLDVLK